MSRYPVWVLVLAACSGSPGELGQGDFEYYCAGLGDPYCDCEDHPDFCSGSSPAIEQILYSRVPSALAVGATFQVRFDAPDADHEVVSASPDMLSDGLDLQALMAGEVGIMGLSQGWVIDFLHLNLVIPTGVRVDRVDRSDSRVTSLQMDPGETAWLRAMPVSGSQILYGHLPCTWSTSSATAIGLQVDGGDNVVALTALATGPATATVSVTLGALTVPVTVTVTDASDLAAWQGGAP